MQQLIQNSKWCLSPCGGLMYFEERGPISFDDFCLHGNRTCSITIPTSHDTTAGIHYELSIPTLNHKGIEWGLCIRAIMAECVVLRADFFDSCQCLIASAKSNISAKISSRFRDVKTLFDVPCDAYSVILSIEFSGTVTACTCCAPFAYFRD